MRFCSSPGWLIIFFRILSALISWRPKTASTKIIIIIIIIIKHILIIIIIKIKPSSSSSHPHHHYHHPFLAAISPIGISGFFSPTKNPTPPPNSSCRFFEVRGWGDVTCTTKTKQTKTHGFKHEKHQGISKNKHMDVSENYGYPPNHPF